ncbi:MAG: T9SS type A sorting domain-containing protein [Bacteroidales bacterium]
MKKLLHINLVAVLIILLCANANAQSQRLVLLEHFTQASCSYCPAWNTAYETLKAANPGKFVIIRHQVSWPGSDPMNAQYSSDILTRVIYYDIQGVPDSRTDGTVSGQMTQSALNTAYAIPSPFTIAVTHSLSAGLDSIFIQVTITASQAFTANGALKAFVNLTENHIHFASAPGSNGETDFYNVIRKMYTTDQGQTLSGTWTNAQSQVINIAQPIPSYIYDLRELEVVAFIQQDGDKRIEQAGYSTKITLTGDANLDAGLSAMTNVPILTCDTTFTPAVTLKNYKSTTLTSATIYWQNATANITLPQQHAGIGSHTFYAWVGHPNGLPADFYPNNNKKTSPFNITTTVVNPPIVEGFQNTTFPPANWLINNPGNDYTWFRTTTAGGFGNSSASAKILFYNIQSGYDEMILPAINLSSYDTVSLSFSVAYARYDGTTNDRLQIYASTNCGTNWTSIYDKAGTALKTAPDTTSPFVPTASQWRTDVVNINTYAGQPEVFLKLKGTSNYGNNLYVDDINISKSAGVNEIINSVNYLSVYPNPFSNNTNVEFSIAKTENVSFGVYNLIGEKVLSIDETAYGAGTHTVTIIANDLSQGVYYLNAIVGDQKFTQKLTIVK